MNPETISPRLHGFDTWDELTILHALWEGQARAIAVVQSVLPIIAGAARAIVERIEPDGRLIYTGSGTSGQLAALDATELPATFGWAQDRVIYRLAERKPGRGVVSEDDAENGIEAMRELDVSGTDAVIAVAASGTTPFTVAAAETARRAGALVIAIQNRVDAPLSRHADYSIVLETGAEVPAGSTRMNAGTAQKAVLNLLSTLTMTRLGRVHDGLMVNLRADRPKFEKRAIRIVTSIARCSETEAAEALKEADGRIKLAILVARGVDREEARKRLDATGDNLRDALAVQGG